MAPVRRSHTVRGAEPGNEGTIDGADILRAQEQSPVSFFPDLIETYVTPNLDLVDRSLSRMTRQLYGDFKPRRRMMPPSTQLALRRKLGRDWRTVRKHVLHRVDRVQETWQDAKHVRLRDKVSFLLGVMTMVMTPLVCALKPAWTVPLYTLFSSFLLPFRIWQYTQRKWTYFLFDYCYLINTLNLVYLWVLPQSEFLFTVCYCAALGPLAFSVATWRNSAVFHSVDKMTSLFIHLYPPVMFTMIVHFVPREYAVQRLPALTNLERLGFRMSLAFNFTMYLIWQLLYYHFIAVRRHSKIESGQRVNSFSTLSQGKGMLARLLQSVPQTQREPLFMLVQMLYTMLTMLPAPILFFRSKRWSIVFLMLLLTLSVWNGASYYVEVWGRRVEKELQQLQREMDVLRAHAPPKVRHALGSERSEEEEEEEGDKKDK